MTDRDRLIELLCKAPLGFKSFENQYYKSTISKIADYLIENGVMVPPCKVGDKLYILYSVTKEIEECDITGFIIQTKHDVIQFQDGTIYTIWDKDYNAHFGTTLFLTREEAEKALEGKNELRYNFQSKT